MALRGCVNLSFPLWMDYGSWVCRQGDVLPRLVINLVLGGLLSFPLLCLSTENASFLVLVLSDPAVETDVVGHLRTRGKRFVCATSLSSTCRWNLTQVRQHFSDPASIAGPWDPEAGIGGKPPSFKDGCLHAEIEFCLYGGVAILPNDLGKVFERYSLADLWCRGGQAVGSVLFGAYLWSVQVFGSGQPCHFLCWAISIVAGWKHLPHPRNWCRYLRPQSRG